MLRRVEGTGEETEAGAPGQKRTSKLIEPQLMAEPIAVFRGQHHPQAQQAHHEQGAPAFTIFHSYGYGSENFARIICTRAGGAWLGAC